VKIALVQQNYTVADLEGNAARIAEAVRQAREMNADLVVTSELALLGYPARDLLLHPAFIRRSWEVLEQLACDLRGGPPVLVGVAEPNDASEGRALFNSAVLLEGGKITTRFRKCLLPTYDVFDEDRYFEPTLGPQILDRKGWKLGVTICEDVWNDRDFWQRRRYHTDPIETLAALTPDCMINLSASPFTVGKQELREAMLGGMAAKHRIPLLYVNQVGGNDDLVFDGRSCAFDKTGRLIARGRAFEEDLILVDLVELAGHITPDDFSSEAEIWKALVLGTRDYVRKCGFERVLLGLSGGVDSSLTAAIAVQAVGAKNVLGVLMPSPYTSTESIVDAQQLADEFGIRTLTIPIEKAMQAFQESLDEAFTGYSTDVTEENLQARIRGNLLMALSNKFGTLLLTTGNKSEIAAGYCTLYGDMSGGLAVISDLPKTMVYRLAAWGNREKNRLPPRVLVKAPSAELRRDQKDQDTLPPYDLLDAILDLHIEHHHSAEEIIAQGFDEETVQLILERVKNSEFKRRQAAPGIKITDCAFGTGWRMPIARQEWERRAANARANR
jgi:NAD+ synthase/NAD+ synthase (glutamine-hydrolysing)